MSVDDSKFTLPETAANASFTEAEWAKAEAAVKRIRDRLAQRCRHIVQASSTTVRKAIDFRKMNAESKRVDEKLKALERDAQGKY